MEVVRSFNPEHFNPQDRRIFAVIERIRGKGTGEHYSEKGIRNPVRDDTPPVLLSTAYLTNPRRMVELGTSYGFSALHLKAGAPNAKLDTVEFDPRVAKEAKANFKEAGVKEVTIFVGESGQFTRKRKNSIDLLFIDHNKENYLPDFLALEPHLSNNAIVMADNVSDRRSESGNLVDYMRQHYSDIKILNTQTGLLLARRNIV